MYFSLGFVMKQEGEERRKGGEIYQGSPLHTSFDSISTQTTAVLFQQPQAGNWDCFHLGTRFQEEKRGRKEKKPSNLGNERKWSTLWTLWLSPLRERWESWRGVAGRTPVVSTEVEGRQAAVCVCLSWHPGVEQMEDKEPLVLPSKGLNINLNVQQHLTSSSPGPSGGEAGIQRDQTRGQAVWEKNFSFGLCYLEIMLGGIYHSVDQLSARKAS